MRIGESNVIKSLRRFVRTIYEVFGKEYLRPSNEYDTTRLLHIAKQRGFSGMVGNLDSMYWKWKNCPASYHGMYCGHAKELTIIVELVASTDLGILHCMHSLVRDLQFHHRR